MKTTSTLGKIMQNVGGLSNEELKELILEQFKDLDIDLDTVEIVINDGPVVVLRGKVGSDSERNMLEQVIMDVVGVDDIVDELVVIQGDSDLYEGSSEESGLYDEDEESMGTEDAYQSIEDGIPYIPPTSPTYQKLPKTIRWKRRRTKTS